jgi:hypothetical protein
MKALNVRHAVAMLTVGAATLCWNAPAHAQTVVVQPGQQPVAPPPPPPPSNTVVVTPGAAEAQPTAPAVVAAPMAPAPVPEAGPRPVNRPNRALLMTGLVLFGAPYVASIGVGAGSGHVGDSDLYIPVLGPWLDLGARGGCPSNGDCGPETGNKVLLVGDGILQTVGALQIIGAFVFPETVGVTTVATNKSGGFLSLTPSKVGHDGYGMSALGQF